MNLCLLGTHCDVGNMSGNDDISVAFGVRLSDLLMDVVVGDKVVGSKKGMVEVHMEVVLRIAPLLLYSRVDAGTAGGLQPFIPDGRPCIF